VDISLFYFADDSGPTNGGGRYDLLLEGARLADREGFAAVWTPERHFHPFGGLYPNPAVTGAAVAAVTERIEIRAGSVVAPLHHPLRIAEEWSVVDNISGGRVAISFASGWHPADFALRPDAFNNRRQVTARTVEQVRRLWAGEELEVLDGTGRLIGVRVYPAPVQPELPVWLTSSGSVETFRAAGTMRAGLLTHLLGQEIDELAPKIDEYRAAYASSDGGSGGRVAAMVHCFLADDPDEAREVVREPFSAYLKSSFGLMAKSILGEERIDPADVSEEDLDFLIDRAFDRYFETAGLFGTVESVEPMIERLRSIGVDDIACLIDFGVERDLVLDSLGHLAEVREICAGVAAGRRG
jgi:natural product biosynthesis luciferase-like monooxygenase protein